MAMKNAIGGHCGCETCAPRSSSSSPLLKKSKKKGKKGKEGKAAGTVAKK